MYLSVCGMIGSGECNGRSERSKEYLTRPGFV